METNPTKQRFDTMAPTDPPQVGAPGPRWRIADRRRVEPITSPNCFQHIKGCLLYELDSRPCERER